MVSIIVAGIVCLLAGPYLYRLWSRERLRAAAREIYTLVVEARLNAVKLNRQVVMWVNPESRLVLAWADDLPYNFIQDPGEPTLLRFRLQTGVFFRCAPCGDGVNGVNAVAFDMYRGDPGITDRIVFRPDGTLLPPEGSNSRAPTRPAAYTATVPYGSINCASCRGIYLSDRRATGPESRANTFRVSINDFGPTGRVSVLKWLPLSQGGNPGETNYVPPPWKWAD
jgi:hypothetical protein